MAKEHNFFNLPAFSHIFCLAISILFSLSFDSFNVDLIITASTKIFYILVQKWTQSFLPNGIALKTISKWKYLLMENCRPTDKPKISIDDLLSSFTLFFEGKVGEMCSKETLPRREREKDFLVDASSAPVFLGKKNSIQVLNAINFDFFC